jgi:hypothetical protein
MVFIPTNAFQRVGIHGLVPCVVTESAPIYSRAQASGAPSAGMDRLNDLLTRGDVSGDMNGVLAAIRDEMQSIQRNITSATSALPIRENLEAEAKKLMPLDTPMRNKVPRVPGAGTAAAWRQLTGLGSNSTGTAVQAFFGESGAPAVDDSTYASKSASYKLMGKLGGITGFAMAAGANFQNQLASEKANKLLALMQNEENAIINGSATSTAAPWGDGTTAFGFNGLINLVTTANGTPAGQVQTTVGALTLAHLDAQLNFLYAQGARGLWMLMSATEVTSLAHLATGGSNAYRIVIDPKAAQIGTSVTSYIHPVTGEPVKVIPSRFLAAGTIIFGCDSLPDGSPSLEMDVLPQAQLPGIAFGENIQGYTAQEIAPAVASPQLFPFIVSVYEVLKMKSALHFCKSTGVTAV